MSDMPNEDELDQALLDAARRGFVEFSTIEELPHVLEHLGPVSGGDILIFRDLDDQTREDATQAVMDYYVEVARAQNRVEVRSVSADVKYTADRLPVAAAAVVPLLVFLPSGIGIEHLTESDMVRAGWQRITNPEETP
jgi:hypothetical protein